MAEDKAQENGQERTLDPTPRRLEKAREDGQFPQSRDLTTLLVLAVFGVNCLVAGSNVFSSLISLVRGALQFSDLSAWRDTTDAWATEKLLPTAGWVIVFIVSSWVCSLLAPLSLVSLRPYFAFKFRAERLNPVSGLSRVFSVDTVQDSVKSTLKIVLILTSVALFIRLNYAAIFSLFSASQQSAFVAALNFLIFGSVFIFCPVVLIALVDVFLQRHQFMKRMRVTPDELRQELKESEGSPELKQKRRRRQLQLASSRMMAALEKADVVITNPEHYAVALRYDEVRMRAPVVVAKGADEIAYSIREKAAELGIPIAPIPPLARVLHQSLKIGEAIPPRFFEAVAEVIAWAYRTKSEPGETTAPPSLMIEETQ